jgi:Carboxypeptidase regulatory-like domain/TonB dependent receptor/TonB-dependent Receptor Plug Domain
MRIRMSATIAALSLMLTGVAFAQETTGTLAGRLVDAQGLAVPGVTVTVTGPQGSKSVVSDAEGRFNAPFLVPGTYGVRAELQGFKAVDLKGVTVSLGRTTDLNIKMEVGGLTETVEVTGSTVVVDTTSATTGAILSSEMFEKIPVGRRMTDTLYLAPGVSATTTGRANPSMSGSSGLDNLYVVDGVNVTNTGYGAIGSYSIFHGSLGTATPFDFVKEVQVKTGGYEAEFGQAMGGVVNVVTKSGSNDLRGSVFSYFRPSALEAGYKTVQTVNGTVNTVGQEETDVGAEAGGRLVPNRLFFFGALNPSWQTRTFNAPDDIENFPLRVLGDVDRERRTLSYSGKVTWQAAAAHRVDASFFGDPSEGKMGPQRTSSLLVQDTSSFSEIDFGGHNQTVRYDGIVGSKLLLEGSFARAYNSLSELPSVDEWRVTDQTGPVQQISGGIGFYEAGNVSENFQYAGKVTYIAGDHQIKGGFMYEDVNYDNITQRTGPTFTAHNGQQTETGASITVLNDVNFGRIWRVTRANFNAERNTTQSYKSFFIQDQWKANDRLTINGGIRYEDEALVGSGPPLLTLDGEELDEFRLKNNWAPRIGFVYDVLGGGRSRLYGNWGRFYARVPNDLAARVLSIDAGIQRGDYFDAGLTRPIPDGTVTQAPGGSQITQHFLTTSTATDLIDPDAKLSYKDEFLVGYEWEALPNTTIGARYIHRNVGRVLEDISPYSAVACDFGVAAACATDYVITNPSSDTAAIQVPGLQPVGFDDPKHNYDSIELTMDRRFSNNWMVLASYRFSRLRGNYEGFFREDNGQSDPGITSLFDFPTNDPNYATIGHDRFGYRGDIRFLGMEGPLPLDRPHQIKINGNRSFDNGLGIGMSLIMTSGKPLTALASLPAYDNDSEIPETERGEGFETVDGFKKRTPFETQIDLQASYVLNFGGNRRLTLLADAFNLFNIRRAVDYNAATEISFQVPNPDFGTITSQNVSGQMYQNPFTLRLGARFGW